MVTCGPATSDRPLAIFDLDGTLVHGDSFLPFLLGCGRARRRVRPFLALPLSFTWDSTRARRSPSAPPSNVYWCRSYGASPKPWWLSTRAVLRFVGSAAAARVGRRPATRAPDLRALGDPLVGQSRFVRARRREVPGGDDVVCTRAKGTADMWDGHIDGPNYKGEAKVELLRRDLGADR